MKTINVGVVGLGTVGTGVVGIMTEHAALLDRRVGARLRISRIASRGEKPRIPVPDGVYTRDPMELVRDPGVDIVVELIGGTTDAAEICLEAARLGKHVVTANKALLARRGLEIYGAAAKAGVDLGFEASVCGAIPVIRAVREGLVGNAISSIIGIVNGTTNYILSNMTDSGRAYADILRDAQAAGFAEADPTMDVDGSDAAAKLQILASVAFGGFAPYEAISREGIEAIDPLDIDFARDLGCRIKLLAIARVDAGELELRVHPALVPVDHPLASIGGAFNAVHIVGDSAGPVVLSGLGAGRGPAASSVVADIVEIARDIRLRRPSQAALLPTEPLERLVTLRPMERVRSRYYLRATALDRPGVLSAISGVLAEHRISIASMIQRGRGEEAAVPVVMLTHDAVEVDMRAALEEIDRLPVVGAPTACLHVEGMADR
jgi:homoserine dehydrogenase